VGLLRACKKEGLRLVRMMATRIVGSRAKREQVAVAPRLGEAVPGPRRVSHGAEHAGEHSAKRRRALRAKRAPRDTGVDVEVCHRALQ